MEFSDDGLYFIRLRGRVTGPFRADRLRGMALNGQLSSVHEISADRTNWSLTPAVSGLLPHVADSARDEGSRPLATPTEERWFYLDANDSRVGPIGRRQLIEAFDRNQIGPGTSVWRKGIPEWIALEDSGLVPKPERAVIRLEEHGISPDDRPIRARGVGYGITAMVLGILSVLNSCLAFIPYAGVVFLGQQLILGVLAICFGASGMRTEGRGMAIAGLVTGIVAVGLFVLMVILVLIFVGSFAAIGAARHWE